MALSARRILGLSLMLGLACMLWIITPKTDLDLDLDLPDLPPAAPVAPPSQPPRNRTDLADAAGAGGTDPNAKPPRARNRPLQYAGPAPARGTLPAPPAPATGDGVRYLTACVVYGRHHNQLVMLAKLWAVALQYNRTLVLPKFMQAAPKGHEDELPSGRELQPIPFERVYSVPGLRRGPVPVVTWDEFFGPRGPHSPAACFLMSNCKPRPTPREFACAAPRTNLRQPPAPLLTGACLWPRGAPAAWA